MTDDEILAIMIENENLKKALQEIAEFCPEQYHGFVDEWEEAHAFTDCQQIARKALGQPNNA